MHTVILYTVHYSKIAIHHKYERLHPLQHSCASYTAALLCVAVMACCMEPNHSKRNSRLHWRPAQVSKQVQCQCLHVLIASAACQKFHVHQEKRKALCLSSNEATTKVQWNRSSPRLFSQPFTVCQNELKADLAVKSLLAGTGLSWLVLSDPIGSYLVHIPTRFTCTFVGSTGSIRK